MMKICEKNGCNNTFISKGRSKYCELHKTKKKLYKNEFNNDFLNNSVNNNISNNILNNINNEISNNTNEKIYDDRKLREEQDKEYLETIKIDKEKLELENILELSKKEYENKMISIINLKDNNSESYNIKICFPNGKKIIKKFGINNKLKNIREYINAYIYINKYNIENYNLIINMPIKKFTKENDNDILKDIFESKNFNLFVENLDL